DVLPVSAGPISSSLNSWWYLSRLMVISSYLVMARIVYYFRLFAMSYCGLLRCARNDREHCNDRVSMIETSSQFSQY
ncbi:MAG: hypothetical protein K0U23_01795, partial [Gammaproteobacteria bacterium]|nr:hypothetical protein [Gammaproteobacteria bacterium]